MSRSRVGTRIVHHVSRSSAPVSYPRIRERSANSSMGNQNTTLPTGLQVAGGFCKRMRNHHVTGAVSFTGRTSFTSAKSLSVALGPINRQVPAGMGVVYPGCISPPAA
eukprot:scaffold133349_cov37-Tisochrysis_lutea.AAC.2